MQFRYKAIIGGAAAFLEGEYISAPSSIGVTQGTFASHLINVSASCPFIDVTILGCCSWSNVHATYA